MQQRQRAAAEQAPATQPTAAAVRALSAAPSIGVQDLQGPARRPAYPHTVKRVGLLGTPWVPLIMVMSYTWTPPHPTNQ